MGIAPKIGGGGADTSIDEICMAGQGFISETWARALNSNHTALTSQRVQFSAIGLRGGTAVTNIHLICNAIGSGVTLFKAGVYTKAGGTNSKLAASADFSASLGTGLLTIPLSSQLIVPGDDEYLLAVLSVWSVTAPQIDGSGAVSAGSVARGAFGWPFGLTAGQADLPASPALAASGTPLWGAVS